MVRHRVVLCADDFGLSDGVSRAILDLGARGRISATSAMTNCGSAQRLGPELRRLHGTNGAGGTIAIGLHLTLTAGAPLGPMPGLAPGGRLPPLGDLLRRALVGRLAGDAGQEVGAEIERQLRAFFDIFGRAPDFVDGHQHVHVLPGIRGRLLACLARHPMGDRRPWLRDPSDRLAAILRRREAAGKAIVARGLALGFAAEAARAGFAANAGFSGFRAFDPGRPAGPILEAAFQSLGRCPVVMCHPGRVDDELRTLDPVLAPREEELAYLGSERFPAFLAQAGITLVPRPG